MTITKKYNSKESGNQAFWNRFWTKNSKNPIEEQSPRKYNETIFWIEEITCKPISTNPGAFEHLLNIHSFLSLPLHTCN